MLFVLLLALLAADPGAPIYSANSVVNPVAPVSLTTGPAGISPPYAGLFQINLRIPEDAPSDPEIRCGFPERMSLAGSTLLIR
jgi:hypothetical protein